MWGLFERHGVVRIARTELSWNEVVAPVSPSSLISITVHGYACFLYIAWNVVTESMATMRSPFWGYNTTWCVELNGEYLSCYSNEIESVSLRKCPYDRWLANKAHLSAVTVTNISQNFTYNMAAKINWYRYGRKLRHCRRMYNYTCITLHAMLDRCAEICRSYS